MKDRFYNSLVYDAFLLCFCAHLGTSFSEKGCGMGTASGRVFLRVRLKS